MKLALYLTVFCYTSAQGRKTVDQLIDTIFTNPIPIARDYKNSINLQPRIGNTESSKEGIPGVCECVPYYLCKNGTIVDNGEYLIDIRIDEEKVCDYFSVCCTPPNQRKIGDPIKHPPEKSKGCGSRNSEVVGFRITGGRDNEAQFGVFNWMLAVLREESVAGKHQKLLVYQCGASLIHPQVALTAAHWVYDKNKQLKVRAGEWDTQTEHELLPHQDRDVASIELHSKFDSKVLTHNYALLFLSSPFEISDNVGVVCLPPPDRKRVKGTRCFTNGWGKDAFAKEGKAEVLLKKIELPIVENADCQVSLRKIHLGKYFVFDDSLMCAGGERGIDTCQADGGSHLVCPIPGHPGRYEQLGIVTSIIGCGADGTAGIYADVAKAYNWIEEELKKRNYETSYYKP